MTDDEALDALDRWLAWRDADLAAEAARAAAEGEADAFALLSPEEMAAYADRARLSPEEMAEAHRACRAWMRARGQPRNLTRERTGHEAAARA